MKYCKHCRWFMSCSLVLAKVKIGIGIDLDTLNDVVASRTSIDKNEICPRYNPEWYMKLILRLFK